MVVKTEGAETREVSLGEYSQQFAEARGEFVSNLKTGASHALDGLLKGVKSFGEGLSRAFQQVDSSINGVGGAVLAVLDGSTTTAQKRDMLVGEAAKAIGQVQQTVGSAVEAGASAAQRAGQSLGEMVENARVDLVQRVQALNDERQQMRVARFVENRLGEVFERIDESKDGGHISREVAERLRGATEVARQTLLDDGGQVENLIKNTAGADRRAGIAGLRDRVADFSEKMDAAIVKAELGQLREKRIESLGGVAPGSTNVAGVMKAHGVDDAIAASDQHQFMICMKEVERDLDRRSRVMDRFEEIEGSRGDGWTDEQRSKFERVKSSFEQDVADRKFTVEKFQSQMASLDRLRTPLHERVLDELERGARGVMQMLRNARTNGEGKRIDGALGELGGTLDSEIGS